MEQTNRTVQEYVNQPSYKDYLSDFEGLPRQFINGGIRDTTNTFDHHYGIVHDLEANKFYLGLTLKPVEFVGNDVQFGGVKYSGTFGLYEFLFKKEPTP